jgi:hypothetical protein
LAESWNPLMKSKTRATKTIVTRRAVLVTMRAVMRF